MKSPKYPASSEVEFSQSPTHRNGLSSLLKPLMICAAILTLSAVTAQSQTLTNWLANPGFELGTASWINMPPWVWNGATWAVQNTNQYVNASTKYVKVHSGTNAFKIWGYYQPYTTSPGAMETFPAAAGSTWTASGWADTQTPDNMTSTETSYIEVQFLDATTNIVTTSFESDCTSPTMTPASPTDTWSQFQVVDPITESTTLTAPSGTAFVRFLIRFTQPAGYPGGSCYWDDVQLIRTSKPDPEITAQPAAVTKVYGQTATFSVTADGLSTLSYKWQKGGADITNPNAYGVTTATLTISNVTLADEDNYTVTVTDQAGSLPSDQAYLTVNDPGVISITPPLGQTINNGGTASFIVAAAGSSPLSYQWQLNGNPLSNAGRISGVTSNVLTVANLTAADAGTYTAMIDGGAAQATSGLKVVSPAQLATNLLINPGFEDSVFSEPWESAWVRFNGAEIDSTNNFYAGGGGTTPVSVYDGNYVCRTYASDPDNGLYQNNVAATAGTTFHVGGHFYMSSLDPMISPAWVVLQLFFKDAGGNTLSTFASPEIGPTFPADTWTFLQLSNTTGGLDLVAPTGTASATCQVYEYAQIGGGGSVYFDDLYVTRVGLPAPTPVTITTWVSGGSINLAFPTTSGVTYQVLYANSLSSPITWYTNSSVSGNGTVQTVSQPIGTGQRYYRLLEHY